MSVLHDLKYSIQKLYRCQERSYATEGDRRKLLNLFANDLVKKLKFGLRDIQGLKQKHILGVVKLWQEQGLKVSTIKNRTAVLRDLCKKINKPNIIPSNDSLNIGKRTYIPVKNRAIFNPDFSKISNQYVLMSLQLQRVFGLRREESLKIKPHMADKGDKLELFPTWCKGGRGRFVPIRTEEQRYWLDQAKLLAGKFENSLIPGNKTYKQQRDVYDKQVGRAGLSNLHGLRHAYAQMRYKELTGLEAPINRGKIKLTKEEKRIDHQGRMILSEELGHSRKSVTRSYIS